jgi:mRNA interferase MazF
VIQRGEIWWASLPEPRGSEPAHHRPVLVVQANSFNLSKINTVLVAVITSNLRLADAPGNVRLNLRQSGLPRESVVNISQLLTLDKKFLTRRIGMLPITIMEDIDAGLKLVLSL